MASILLSYRTAKWPAYPVSGSASRKGQFQALQAERDADDGDHQYQSGDEVLQGNMQPSENDPDDVS